MHLIYRNVNEAFRELVHGIWLGSDPNLNRGSGNLVIPTIKTESRNGPVLQIPEPVIITYTHPRERVLFNKARDANPFFHLFESLWMLAGRNDIAPLTYYAKQMAEYSDDGKTANGAYGYRWRNHVSQSRHGFPDVVTDQLPIIIDRLRNKPEDRRCVLQMWNVEDDLLKINTSKDVCCNLSVMFSLRDRGNVFPIDEVLRAVEAGDDKGFKLNKYALDMTVTNRSNDLIWGTLGANVVHFSMLQEYMANCLGVEVGVYNQFSNNLHVYTESNSGWHPKDWLQPDEVPLGYGHTSGEIHCEASKIPLVEDQKRFDDSLNTFINVNHQPNGTEIIGRHEWKEPFLAKVAQPMCDAFHAHKQRDYEAALNHVDRIEATDWKIAARIWIWKRRVKHEGKSV